MACLMMKVIQISSLLNQMPLKFVQYLISKLISQYNYL